MSQGGFSSKFGIYFNQISREHAEENANSCAFSIHLPLEHTLRVGLERQTAGGASFPGRCHGTAAEEEGATQSSGQMAKRWQNNAETVMEI